MGLYRVSDLGSFEVVLRDTVFYALEEVLGHGFRV